MASGGPIVGFLIFGSLLSAVGAYFGASFCACGIHAGAESGFKGLESGFRGLGFGIYLFRVYWLQAGFICSGFAYASCQGSFTLVSRGFEV